ncbi:MAG: TIR domain-containing protein [Ktedonobacteraceae bacterium]
MTTSAIKSVNVFYCYAHEDEALRDELDKHLSALKQRGWVSSWNEGEILAGSVRNQEIESYLRSAHIILLLVSADFISSEFCSGSEMWEVLKKHEAGEVIVIPIILRPVDWQDAPFSHLQALPKGAKPVTNWSNRDDALLDIEQGIRKAVKALLKWIFISSVPADRAFALQLKNDLETQGYTVWGLGDESELDPEHRALAVQPLIRDSQAVLLIASPEARYDRTVKADLHYADIYQQYIVPVWATGLNWTDILPPKWPESFYVDARGEHYTSAVQNIVTRLRGQASSLLMPPLGESSQPDELDTNIEPKNPYKGLEPFRGGDRRYFFGRDEFVRNLLQSLQYSLDAEKQERQGSRFLAIVGPSGSGKSSLAMAGLLPRLQDGKLPGSKEWKYLRPIVPGEHPFEALTVALADHFPERDHESLLRDLKAESARGLHVLASQIAQQPETKVVLLVDQFEELFTLTTSEDERQRFIDVLVTALTEPGGSVLLILTMRADFYDRPVQYPALAKLIEEHHQLVLPMSLKDLREILEKPAALPDVQLTFQDELVGDMLFEIQGQVGALPLLQFTLDQLFQRRSGHQLTIKAYQELGGVKGALSKKAEETYLTLPSDEHRRLARTLFMRLINPGATEQDTTRRRAALDELTLSDPKQNEMLQKTKDDFIAARLLTTDEVVQTLPTKEVIGTPTIEVSHEALIREWSRLSNWLREARDDLPIQKRVTEDAVEWKQKGLPVDRLYRGTELAEALAWANRNQPSVNEQAFLKESFIEQKRERRAKTRQRWMVGALVVFLVLAITSIPIIISMVQARIQGSSLSANVTNLNDDGSGSLRQAIRLASPGDTIRFAQGLKGTIFLTSGELKIEQNIFIDGPGANVLTISGSHMSRVFHIIQGTNVTISRLTIADGFYRFTGPHLSFTPQGGGGILNEGDTFTLTESTVSDNIVEQGDGGGILNYNGQFTLMSSTISGNRTINGNGAGISTNTQLNCSNSTISDNTAPGGNGGGIYEDKNGSFVINFCTIANNSADAGGGIAIARNAQLYNYLSDDIIAENSAQLSPDVAGGVICNSRNLIQNPSGAVIHYTDRNGTIIASPGPDNRDSTPILGQLPRLGTLQDNGGPTWTQALLPGSPAIGVAYCSNNVDQRGNPRPDNHCDLGAYQH